MALTIFALGAPIGAWIAADFTAGYRSIWLAYGISVGSAPPGWYLACGCTPLCANHAALPRSPVAGRFTVIHGDDEIPVEPDLRGARGDRQCGHRTLGLGLIWWTPTYLMRTYS